MNIERKGRIEIIAGSMFSGKSEELIRKIKRAEIARQITQVFKPSLDNRYGLGTIDSHDRSSHQAFVIENSKEIYKLLDPNAVVVGIDECQFLDEDLIKVCKTLAGKGIRVIGAGLPLDFKGEPFGGMPDLLAEADQVDTLHAICMVCFGEASRTQRIIKEKINGRWKKRPAHYTDPLILVAAGEDHSAKTNGAIKQFYEARCRFDFIVPGHPDPAISKGQL